MSHACLIKLVLGRNSTGSIFISIFNETLSRPCLHQQTLAFAQSKDDEDYACGERTVARMCELHVDRWYR